MSYNQKSLDNLKPFPKGHVSKSPRRGRPKDSPNYTTLIRRLGDDPKLAKKVLKAPPEWFDDLPRKTLASAITVSMMVKAINGDVHAANWVVERGFGKEIEAELPDEKEIVITTFAIKGDEADARYLSRT